MNALYAGAVSDLSKQVDKEKNTRLVKALWENASCCLLTRRFGGEATVEERTGGLLYVFPSLQATAQRGRSKARGSGKGVRGQSSALAAVPTPEPLEEQPFEFSNASPGQVMGVSALAVLNAVGVVILGSYLRSPVSWAYLSSQGLGFVARMLPGLQVFASAFFIIPLLRVAFNALRNSDIQARNESREQAYGLLNAPGAEVRQKLQAARQLSSQTVIGNENVVYTTEQPADPQLNQRDLEDWDRKILEKNRDAAGW